MTTPPMNVWEEDARQAALAAQPPVIPPPAPVVAAPPILAIPRAAPVAAPATPGLSHGAIGGVVALPPGEGLPAAPSNRITMAQPGETNQGQRGTSGGGPNLGPISLSQPLMVRTGGSPGGITAIGRVGQQTLPAQAAAQREGEEAKAGAMDDAANRGYQTAAAYSMAQDRDDEYQRRAEEERALQNAVKDRTIRELEADAAAQKNEKINPNAMFEGEHGDYNQMLAIIGGALGGYVQARTGRNPFMEAMNAKIERNIAGQKADLEAKAESRKSKHAALLRDAEKYGSNEAALMKRRADMWDAVAQQARGYETLAKSDLMKGDAQAMGADAEANAQQWRLKTAEWMAAHTVAPSGGGAQLNPAAVAEYVAKGGDIAALQQRFAAAKSMGLGASAAGVVALQGPNMNQEQRNEAFKEGIKGPGYKDEKLKSEEGHRVSTGLAAAGIPEAEANLAKLKAMVADAEPGEMPAGLGMGSRVLHAIPGGKYVQGDKAAVNRATIKSAISGRRKVLTGVAYSEPELEEATDHFIGENVSRAALDAAIRGIEQDIAMKRSTVMAGVSPEAADTFDARRAAQLGRGAGPAGGANVAFKPAGR